MGKDPFDDLDDNGLAPEGDLPFVKGSRTSLQAAQNAKPRQKKQAFRIFNYLLSISPLGMICDEVEAALDFPHQSASPRMGELEAAGCVQKIGETRLTRAKEEAEVYAVVPGATFDLFKEYMRRKRAAEKEVTRQKALEATVLASAKAFAEADRGSAKQARVDRLKELVDTCRKVFAV